MPSGGISSSSDAGCSRKSESKRHKPCAGFDDAIEALIDSYALQSGACHEQPDKRRLTLKGDQPDADGGRA
jgi:hypothetical protein